MKKDLLKLLFQKNKKFDWESKEFFHKSIELMSVEDMEKICKNYEMLSLRKDLKKELANLFPL